MTSQPYAQCHDLHSLRKEIRGKSACLMIKRLVVLALCWVAGPVSGEVYEVYKCQDGKGNVVYSDSPCGQVGPLVKPSATDGTVGGLRPGEEQWLRDIKDREAAERKENERREAEQEAALRGAKQDAKLCRSAKRHIAEVEEELWQGYKAKRAEKLKRKLAEYKEDAGIYCK